MLKNKNKIKKKNFISICLVLYNIPIKFYLCRDMLGFCSYISDRSLLLMWLYSNIILLLFSLKKSSLFIYSKRRLFCFVHAVYLFLVHRLMTDDPLHPDVAGVLTFGVASKESWTLESSRPPSLFKVDLSSFLIKLNSYSNASVFLSLCDEL